MTIATKKRGKTKVRRRTLAPKRWRNILCAIPGYDPFIHAEGCWFDAAKADYYVEFIETQCSHIEGPLAGQPFKLETWEKAIIGNLFGWYTYNSDNIPVRRYLEAFIFVPRKNGKTPLSASIANSIFFCDRELGQQNFCMAADTEQAKLMFRHIEGMIHNNPDMDNLCQVHTTYKSIIHNKRGNSIKVLSGEGKSKSGRKSKLILIDELHEVENRDLVTKMTTSTASKNTTGTLIVYITTSDFDRPSICNEKYDYACAVRDNKGDKDQPGYDPGFLPVIYEAMHRDEKGHMVEDDWTKPETWYKANPNLGVSVDEDWFRREVQKAKTDLAYQNDFKRYHLNIKTQQYSKIIPLTSWDRCGSDIEWEQFIGMPVWPALDIASARDFTDLAMVFSSELGEPSTIEYEDFHGNKAVFNYTKREYWVKHICWLPKNPVNRDSKMQSLIDGWSDRDYIIRTPGNAVDYDIVFTDIIEFLKPFLVQRFFLDVKFQGLQMAQNLQKIYGDENVLQYPQNLVSFACPFMEILRLIESGEFHHDNDPVLRWMAGNTVAVTRHGLTRPDKDKSTEKIDGIVATIMAVYNAMTAEAPKRSVYESRDVRTV